MNIIADNPTGPAVIGGSTAAADFSLSAVVVDTVVSGSSSSPVTVHDVVQVATTTATVDREMVIQGLSVAGDVFSRGVTYDVSDSGVATVDVYGKVTRTGTAQAVATVGCIVRTPWISRRIDVGVGRVVGTVSVAKSWVEGSLAGALTDTIDAAVAGKTMAAHGPLFSPLSINTSGTRNPDCWASIADLTCISISRPNTTAIGQWYGVQAHHYPTSSARFVDNSNVVHTRSVTASRQIGETDLRVVKFNAALPSEITPALLPPDYATLAAHLPTIGLGIPCLCLDQEKKALVSDLYSWWMDQANFTAPTKADHQEFYEPRVDGDSGSSAFFVLPVGAAHRLVLVTGWTRAVAGPNYSAYLTEINAAMADMGGEEEVIEADLSAYPTY